MKPESGAHEKSPAAFKTISEAADQLGLPQHVLRFWESKFKQIKPMKLRGGRRYYRPQDIEIISTIRHLLYEEGYTIEGAKKAFEQVRRAQKASQSQEVGQKAMSAAIRRAGETLPGAAPAAGREVIREDNAATIHAAARRHSLRGLYSELLNLRKELDAMQDLVS